VTVGGEILDERFTSRGIAPSRTSPAAHVDAGAGGLLALTARFYAVSEVAVQSHFFMVEDQAGTRELTGRFALRVVLAAGAWL
jgi:hypothetical protein